MIFDSFRFVMSSTKELVIVNDQFIYAKKGFRSLELQIFYQIVMSQKYYIALPFIMGFFDENKNQVKYLSLYNVSFHSNIIFYQLIFLFSL
jgi:hypothetical protein